MSYIFWNNFIDTWRTLPLIEYLNPSPLAPYRFLHRWTNPNLLPLYGTSNHGDLSLQYLPEPWWGNNGHYPLESVVLNYNPAGLSDNYYGISAQQHFTNSSALFRFHHYSDFVNNEVIWRSKRFPGKYTFHYSNRANRVFDSLYNNGITLVGNNLENHLSIELAPWYTPNSNLILPYIVRNAVSVYNYCILFAANESRRIINPILQNKVIIRASRDSILGLLPFFGPHTIIYDKTTASGNGRWYKFILDAIPDIEFICIWGPRSRNDFPPIHDLDEILINL
jgi:hypothetical protein